jgi:predicted CXXCH cytochrome family protein
MGVMCLCVVAAWTAGCSATTRHRVLTFLFDGVPPLEAKGPSETKPPANGTDAVRPRQPALYEHGPYAARLCGSCHDAAATNALVAPRDRLCLRCHNLGPDKKYVHGPLASGGCLTCHDPHSSAYRFLLVSGPDTLCLGCHEARDVAQIEAHGGAVTGCTSCHDAHMSDTKYLLK